MKFNYIFIASIFIFLCSIEIFAQSDKTFVATTGIDNTACGASASPCRTFTFALTKTNGGGEVIALDSGLYDSAAINITASVTLTAAPGAHVEVSGINVNATTSSAVVLRNLYLHKLPGEASSDGIKVMTVSEIHIENCVVHGFANGINFTLNNAAQVFISDTIVRYCISRGISFATDAGLIKASINRSQIENSGHFGPVGDGVVVFKRARVTVRDTISTGNSGAGFVVINGELSLENCEASNNTDGVIAAFNTTGDGNALVSNTIVTHNTRTGFRQEGTTSVFNSLGNNVVRKNGANTFGTIGTVSPM